MGWFKRASYPEFWLTYANQFKSQLDQDIESTRFVIFDTETTGLNPSIDRILSIGCIAIVNLKIKVADQLEIYVDQDTFNSETVKIHGLLKTGNLTKFSEEEALISFLDYIKDAVLVAHHAAFDIAMINASLKRLRLPKLKNRVVDTGRLYLNTHKRPIKQHWSLDELSKKFSIPLHDRHTASGDAFITAVLFLKLVALLKHQKQIKLNDLLVRQRRIGLL